MRFDIMTLFPEMLENIFNESIIGRARRKKLVDIRCHNIRDFAGNKHNKVDDTPYGGGMGMLMASPPVYDCYTSIIADAKEKPFTVYLSPKGKKFTQETAKTFLSYNRIILLCGHYEGIDQRVLDEIVDEEISIGDFVLTGGELPAAIVVDAVSRMIDGVLANEDCYKNESLASGLLEYPQYTRPYDYHGIKVPDVLLSGNHEKIETWRFERALEITREKRPDLYEKINFEEKRKELKKQIEKACHGGTPNDE